MTCTGGNFRRHVWAAGKLPITTRQPFLIILCRLPEKGRRDRRDSRGDEGEGQRVKRNRNERKETKEIKNIPPPPLPERVDRGGGDTGIRGAGDGAKRGEERG